MGCKFCCVSVERQPGFSAQKLGAVPVSVCFFLSFFFFCYLFIFALLFSKSTGKLRGASLARGRGGGVLSTTWTVTSNNNGKRASNIPLCQVTAGPGEREILTLKMPHEFLAGAGSFPAPAGGVSFSGRDFFTSFTFFNVASSAAVCSFLSTAKRQKHALS